MFNATNIVLLHAIAREVPGSIRELARLVKRYVSPVYRDLDRLEDSGLVTLEQDIGQTKRPIVPYDKIDISVPLTLGDHSPDGAAASS